MPLITIYRDDMNNPIHGNLFENLLTDLGIDAYAKINGRSIDKGINCVDIVVTNATPKDEMGDKISKK